jgi:hypothetical protein
MLISDRTQAVVRLLGNRSDVAALVPEQMAGAVKELSDTYPFEELRVTGPVKQFTPGQGAYPSSFFEQPQGGNPFPYVFNKMISWWVYLEAPTSFQGGSLTGGSNPGYGLKFRDIENLEVLINTLTTPMFWSQFGAQGSAVAGNTDDTFYIAGVPNQAYYTYARYQFLHPFSAVPAPTDAIYMPATWSDIIEYATAERIALQLRMSDVADRFHMKLFGDPKHPGEVGLIRQRVSQTQKNQSRTTRGIKIQVQRY